MDDLLSKKCIPCEGGTPPLAPEEVTGYLKKVSGWEVSLNSQEIFKEFVFKDFMGAMNFANDIAKVAEAEGHHPDLTISWGKVIVSLTTHSIGGLSENDFILAAKIDTLLPK
jgi:4a-hydroxytetrahydrobiopterin dehydratase